MSEKMNYKVYVHIAPNGKRYYGITKQEVEARWKNGKGYEGNKYFYRAINKHGWGNFEHIVIAKGLSEEEAKWLEIELIRELDTTNREYGYNITKGGDSNPMDNEESRKKLSETRKGENNPNYGKTFSEETRKKMSEAHKGENNPNYGKTFSKEHRKKIGKAMKGKTLSEKTKQKMSESHKGENNPKATKVYCVELDMVFNTVSEASKFVGCNNRNISNVLRGRRKTAGGYHWLYAEQ